MSSTDRSQARATKKKSKEQEMLKRAKDKAAARHAALLEQQAAAAKARGVTVGAKVKHTNKPPDKLSTATTHTTNNFNCPDKTIN
jgi:hypothetical protein